ncbi:hypothetical protein BDN67DRAFT_992590 [Paxillus ammoniavirescens]|nr:hypothetical protein BDN67DRAFT_992590 [Paxillus ammoniavirescens]
MNIDFFNVEGVHVRGQTTSCGVISCACLNLPLIYTTNLRIWERGVHFNRTALHPAGQVVRSVVVCVVCDLPVARKAAQLFGPRSHFYCSICNCSDLKTLGRMDFDSDLEEYKNVNSATEQEKLFSKNGVHWSPLWRLPYWDMACQLVIDAMHCILEGITGFHVCDVLRLTTTIANAPELLPPLLSIILVIECIWSVIRSVDTPSWLSSVPHEFGVPKAGTLKANKWCTIITVYLPLTLVNLWGDGTTHKSRAITHQLHEALDHTMALVSAIHIACAMSMTTKRTVAYQSYMDAWLSQLKTIHPSVNYCPNGHMVIHIHHFLLSFGPVQLWWCSPFERLIGQLQCLPTNDKFGMYQLRNNNNMT